MKMTPTLVLGAIINKVLEMPNCLCMENVSKVMPTYCFLQPVN